MARQQERAGTRSDLEAEAREWRARIDGQLASGLTQEEYCRRQGLSVWTFRRWKYRKLPSVSWSSRAKRQTVEALSCAAEEMRLVPVEVDFEASRDEPSGREFTDRDREFPGIEVVVPGGSRILLRPGFDAETLRRAFEVLRC